MVFCFQRISQAHTIHLDIQGWLNTPDFSTTVILNKLLWLIVCYFYFENAMLILTFVSTVTSAWNTLPSLLKVLVLLQNVDQIPLKATMPIFSNHFSELQGP